MHLLKQSINGQNFLVAIRCDSAGAGWGVYHGERWSPGDKSFEMIIWREYKNDAENINLFGTLTVLL